MLSATKKIWQDKWLRLGSIIIGLVYLACALIFVVERYIQQKLPNYTAVIEERLHDLTGYLWELEGLSITYRGLDPVVSLTGIAVRVPSPESNESPARGRSVAEAGNEYVMDAGTVLDLRDLEVYLDLSATVYRRQPILYGVRASRVGIGLEYKEGSWIFPGLEAGARSSGFDWLSFVDSIRYVDCDAVSLDLRHPAVSALPDLVFKYRHDNGHRELLFDQKNGGNESEIRLHAAMVEDNAISGDVSIDVYATTARDGLSRWLNAFFVTSEIQNIAGEFLLSKKPGKAINGVVSVHEATMALSRLMNRATPDSRAEQGATPPSISIDPFSVLLTQPDDNAYSAVWPKLAAEFSGDRIQFDQGRLVYTNKAGFSDELSLQMSALNLDYLNYTLTGATTWERILGNDLISIVRVLNPRGTINDFSVTFPVNRIDQFKTAGHLEDVAVSPFGPAPGGTGISGGFAITSNSGSVDIDAQRAMSLDFPTVYDEPLFFRQVEGRVSWSIGADRVLVQGNELRMHSYYDSATFTGSFFTNSRIAGDEASTLTLEIGVNNGYVENLLQLVPAITPRPIAEWLNQANAKGYVERGGFFFNGSLRGDEGNRRSVDMFFELADAELDYLPEWPGVTGVSGLLVIQDGAVEFSAENATSMDLALSDIQLAIDKVGQEQILQVELGVAGDTSNLLRLLKVKPLEGVTGGALAEWEAGGKFRDGTLKLEMPLTGTDGEKISVEAQVELLDSSLNMSNFELELQSLNGVVGYSTERNLSGSEISGRLWGRPVEIEMGARKLGPDVTDVSARGSVDIATLEKWLDLPLKKHFSGETEVSLQLSLGGEASLLSLASDLQGLAIDLPGTYAKAAAGSRNFHLNWQFSRPGQPMALDLADTGRMLIGFDENRFDGAVIRFSERSTDSTEAPAQFFLEMQEQSLYARDRLTFTGTIEQADYDEWMATIALYSADVLNRESSGTDVSANANTPLDVRGKDLHIEQLALWGKTFNETALDFNRYDKGWQIDLSNRIVAGTIRLPDDVQLDLSAETEAVEDAPLRSLSGNAMPSLPDLGAERARIDVDLRYLKLDSTLVSLGDSGNSAVILPAEGVLKSFLAPESLYPLNVQLDELYWSNEALGSWVFKLTASKNAAIVHELRAQPYGLQMDSDRDDGLLWAYDEKGELVSSLSLKLSSYNFGEFLRSISKNQQDLPMVSQSMDADVSLSWPGDPTQMKLAELEGEFDFEFGQGRFFKASQSATGLLKLLGLINFDTLVRRVQLDFADVYKEGLSFDKITGRSRIADNKLYFNESPIELVGPSSNFKLLGEVDLGDNTIEAELVATLPVASNLPWIAALAGGLPVAAGTFVFTQVFGDQITKLSSASYTISGNLKDPQVKFGTLFKDTTSAGNAAEKKGSRRSP